MNIWKKSNLNKIIKKKITYQPFNNSIWKKKILKNVKINKADLKKNYTKYFLASSPLPIMLLGMKKKKISIADYGSGDQEIFFQLTNLKLKNTKITIDSTEVPEIKKLLKKIIEKKTKNIKINFYDNFNFKKKYDFVHISDSIQYNLDWKNFLLKIALQKPEFIILNNLTAGNFKTYIAEQKFYKYKLPYIFFNQKEITGLLKNYKVHQYLYLNKINNKFQVYPQKNFRKSDRLQYPKTIIFKKN